MGLDSAIPLKQFEYSSFSQLNKNVTKKKTFLISFNFVFPFEPMSVQPVSGIGFTAPKS